MQPGVVSIAAADGARSLKWKLKFHHESTKGRKREKKPGVISCFRPFVLS